jgi:pimeloyl-ACP methyl ester carboxylesterase
METKMPLFFIIGRQDSRMPYNKVIAQAMMVHHAEIMLIDGIGHMGFLEAPGQILPALRDFFRRNGQ